MDQSDACVNDRGIAIRGIAVCAALVAGCVSHSGGVWEPLPLPATNNAVASVRVGGRTVVFSAMGIGATKRFDAITRRAFIADDATRRWREIAPVPGERGRIAASAAGVDGRIYLFGGYTVDADAREESSSQVDIYEPRRDTWTAMLPARRVSLPSSLSAPALQCETRASSPSCREAAPRRPGRTPCRRSARARERCSRARGV